MVPPLAAQSVVVTGAARGVGKEIATRLCSRGARVVLADILSDEVEQTAAGLRDAGHDVRAVAVDIAELDSVTRLVELGIAAFGRIHSLVNNAGIDSPRGTALDIGEAEWRDVIDVDLNGQWWVTHAILPHMVEQGGGKIVFISSVAARLGGKGFSPAYAAAKAGVLGLTNALAVQLEGAGVLVNAVLPGTLGTTGSPLTDVEREEYLRTHPLGFGGPSPVAAAVEYLLDTSGDWISGTHLNVSGGKLRGP